ncbi:MAG: ATP-binding protein [Spirochaetaceae bacterium]|nr:MAG: ATP-binding protein [Spirochaetaceae bacterium]
MTEQHLYPRYLLPRLLEALEDSPVTLIHGPRQCGKTTLAQMVGEEYGFSYITFDDDVQRAAAQTDPVGFVADLPQRAVLDEVQRVPQLFTSLKAAVDSHREPGRLILTGSANVLLLPQLADSLVGRMEVLRLHPLAQTELESGRSDFIQTVFTASFKAGAFGKRQGKALAERVAAGGYPAAIAREKPQRRATWYRDYIDTLIQRDIRDLARISALHALPRLLALAASQTARLVNVTELAAPFQISRPTIREYLTLLSQIFLVDELPAWHHNRLKRLVKAPKLHIGDSGLLCGLLGLDAHELWEDRGLFGQVLETFIYLELQRQASWREDKVTFSHYRDKDQVEVDIVMETGRQVAGVEVKASSTVKSDDFAGLRKLRQAVGKGFAAGVVLYDGDAVVGFGERLYAVPISTLWTRE